MDEDNLSLPNNLFISQRYEFQATRVIGQRLSSATIKIKVDFSTLDEDTDEYASRMEIALAKMAYWVEKVLNNSILIDAENEWAIDCFIDGSVPSTTNMVVLAPEAPSDACLAELLVCKLRAISDGAFHFHALDIESSDGRGMGFTFVGSFPGESFPEPGDWLTDHNYFTKQWWNRGDASTIDVIPDEDDDLNDPPLWAYSLGFIADAVATPPVTSVVVRPEFRPKVIEGGKVD